MVKICWYQNYTRCKQWNNLSINEHMNIKINQNTILHDCWVGNSIFHRISFHGHISCCWLLSSPGYKLHTATVTDLRQGVYMLCQCRFFACFSHSMSFIGNKFKALMVKMGTSVLTKGVFDYSLRAYLFMYTRCIPITHYFYFLQLHLLCRVNIFHQHKT